MRNDPGDDVMIVIGHELGLDFNRSGKFFRGKPMNTTILADRSLWQRFETEELMEVYSDWFHWDRDVRPTLPESEQIFITHLDDVTITVDYTGGIIHLRQSKDI